MKYVYILRSTINADKYYVGSTNDLQRRFKEHNSGESIHTKKFMPWDLITYIAFSDSKKADAFEMYLKSASGRAFSKKRL